MPEPRDYQPATTAGSVVVDHLNPPEDTDEFGMYADVKKAFVEAGKAELDKMIDEAGLPPWMSLSRGPNQPDDEVAFALTRLGRDDDDENDYFGALESVKRSQPISRRPRRLDRD